MTVEPNNGDIRVDYDSPSILYSPSQEWRQSISGKDPGTPIEITYNVSASLQVNFTGSHIWYYGDFHTDHGNCSILIDNGDPVTVSTRYQYWLPVQNIWDTDLTPGPHSLTIVNMNDKAPVTLAYLIYRPLPATEHISPAVSSPTANLLTANSPTASSPTASSSPASSSPASSPTASSPTTSLSQGMPVATVAGLVLGLIAATICAVLIVGILVKRARGPIDAKKWTNMAEYEPRWEKSLYRAGGPRKNSVSTLSHIQSTA